jgi:hypothetical protein
MRLQINTVPVNPDNSQTFFSVLQLLGVSKYNKQNKPTTLENLTFLKREPQSTNATAYPDPKLTMSFHDLILLRTILNQFKIYHLRRMDIILSISSN